MELLAENIPFFYTFGVDGLKNLIIQDASKVKEKLLFGTEKLNIKNAKITLVNVNF